MSFTYKYGRPALTVDCVVFGIDDDALQVLLIERGGAPFKGCWALPGGFVQVGEAPETAARRELCEETGLDSSYLEQLCTVGTPDRDPREHVVTIAYMALVNVKDHRIQAATDASNAAWFSFDDLPDLAFDHAEIVQVAATRLRNKVRYCPIGFELLPEKFALSQLQHIYEVILEKPLDKRNFRRKILSYGFIAETDEIQKDVAHRAARLYTFDRDAYEAKERDGMHFEV